MTKLQRMKFGIACLLVAASAHAQSKELGRSPVAVVRVDGATSSNLLRDLDSSLEKVVAKVSPAVVQIVVNGYGPLEDRGHTDTSRIVRQHAIGSGVIVDSDGYIITNAHVVEGAERIRVILPPPAESTIEVPPLHAGQILDAKVLGTHKQVRFSSAQSRGNTFAYGASAQRRTRPPGRISIRRGQPRRTAGFGHYGSGQLNRPAD